MSGTTSESRRDVFAALDAAIARAKGEKSGDVHRMMEIMDEIMGVPRVSTVGLERPYDFPLIFHGAEDEDEFIAHFATQVKLEFEKREIPLNSNFAAPFAVALSSAFNNQAARMEEHYAREVAEDEIMEERNGD